MNNNKREKCKKCKYREINGKPHQMCKCCINCDRFVKDTFVKH